MSTQEDNQEEYRAQEVVSELLGDADEIEHPNTSPVPVMPQLGVAVSLLFLVFGVTYVGATHSLKKQELANEVRVENELSKRPEVALSLSSAFEDLTLEARSAIVWDVRNQRVLFNKNADAELPLASVTKLMTALIAYELLDASDKVSIGLDALKVEGDSGFVDGEEFTVQNLSDLTLISSSNDGASALSARGGSVLSDDADPEKVFVTAMNLRAEELGLRKTHFKNSTGLDLSPTVSGATGSARDMALLMDYIVTNVTDAVALTNLEVTTIKNENGDYHIARNTNQDVNIIDGLIASKTGYTSLSGGNLVVAFNAGLNRPIVVVVLGSSYDGRFTDTEKLIEGTRQYITHGGK